MDRDQPIVAITVYAEASGEPEDGRYWVAWTMVNRAYLRPVQYGATPAEAALKLYQYSCWNGDAADRRDLLRALSTPSDDPIWMGCLEIARAVLDPTETDSTGGCTHYYRAGTPVPMWAPVSEFVAQIGNHRFYRNVP